MINKKGLNLYYNISLTGMQKALTLLEWLSVTTALTLKPILCKLKIHEPIPLLNHDPEIDTIGQDFTT